MANQENIKHAAATSEYFTLVMRRKPVRPQTRTAEKTTNKLKPERQGSHEICQDEVFIPRRTWEALRRLRPARRQRCPAW